MKKSGYLGASAEQETGISCKYLICQHATLIQITDLSSLLPWIRLCEAPNYSKKNQVNIIAADTLALGVTKSSAGMVLTTEDIFIQKLTHWGQDEMDAISQTTLSSAFSWMKVFEFWLKFHWSLFLRVKLTISSIGSDNGLVLSRWQAIIWTNVGKFTNANMPHLASMS